MKKWTLEYQKVYKTFLCTYLRDNSESSDSCDSSDSNDSSDSSDSSNSSDSSDSQKKIVTKLKKKKIMTKLKKNSDQTKKIQKKLSFFFIKKNCLTKSPKLQLRWNSKTQIVMKLKNSNCDQTQIVMKPKKLILWWN